MAARVFGIEELATQIATHLFAISPRSTLALALTCRALEVPALRAFWETRGDLQHLIMQLLPTDAWCFIFPYLTYGFDDVYDDEYDYDDASYLILLVGSLFSSTRYPTYSLITTNSTDAKATTRDAGAE